MPDITEKEEVPEIKEQETPEKLSQESPPENEELPKPPQIITRKSTKSISFAREGEYDYEPVYTSLMEWLLLKTPGSLGGTVMIDDADTIMSVDVLLIIIRLYKQVPEYIKQKVRNLLIWFILLCFRYCKIFICW